MYLIGRIDVKIQDAARAQYRRHSIYTVYLTGPAGEREEVGTTQRRSGQGLLIVLRCASVQARVRRLPGAAAATVTKRADRLIFSNGWCLEFGGTLLQEAERSE